MGNLTPEYLQAIIDAAEASFNYTCNILVYSGMYNSYGQEVATYPTTISGVSCGYYPTKSMTLFRGQITFPEYDAELRISLDQEISIQNRIYVNSSNYEIDGLNVGLSCITMTLKELDI